MSAHELAMTLMGKSDADSMLLPCRVHFLNRSTVVNQICEADSLAPRLRACRSLAGRRCQGHHIVKGSGLLARPEVRWSLRAPYRKYHRQDALVLRRLIVDGGRTT